MHCTRPTIVTLLIISPTLRAACTSIERKGIFTYPLAEQYLLNSTLFLSGLLRSPCSTTALSRTEVFGSLSHLFDTDIILGGIVLWSRSFTPEASHLASSSASPVNSLIREALIEGRTTDEKYEKDGYAVKWTFVNDLELIFVVAYQRILQLTYVDELLVALKTLFMKMFEPFLATFVTSLHKVNAKTTAAKESPTSWNFSKVFERWDQVFDKLLRELEDKVRHFTLHMIFDSSMIYRTGNQGVALPSDLLSL